MTILPKKAAKHVGTRLIASTPGNSPATDSRATARVAPTIERQMLLPYPVDMSSFLQPGNSVFDANGILYHLGMQRYSPVDIARYALAQWNRYCQTGDESCLESFLAQADWLVKNERRIAGDAGGWPIQEDVNAPIYLSAIAQSCGLSVLLRAHQIMSQQ